MWVRQNNFSFASYAFFPSPNLVPIDVRCRERWNLPLSLMAWNWHNRIGPTLPGTEADWPRRNSVFSLRKA